jgi:aspartyl/asparaginyl-tRNA synthetase
MKDTFAYNEISGKLRAFFVNKDFIEVPAQSRTSILAACEDPRTITKFRIGGEVWPLPQTGQMQLEWELLTNPNVPGFFCQSYSYRDEPNPIPGRHDRMFPMFEFEGRGDVGDLRETEEGLLRYLGFENLVGVSYEEMCTRYGVSVLDSGHEGRICSDIGQGVYLSLFPERTHPFWNMKHNGGELYSKIDVILHGQETIGSAERETDIDRMRQRFVEVSLGEYAKLLYDNFGRERVDRELDEYLALPMVQRYGGGIGMTRMARAMELSGLLDCKREVVSA